MANLSEELAFSQKESRGLIFTVYNSELEIVECVADGDEDGFTSFKGCVAKEIAEWFERAGRLSGEIAPRLQLDVMIEQTSQGD